MRGLVAGWKSLLERNRALNLSLVAAHIDELRRQAFPESKDRPLSKAEIGALAYMYNAGFDERIAQNPKIVETDNFQARSKNGIDLFNKWQAMGQLLET